MVFDGNGNGQRLRQGDGMAKMAFDTSSDGWSRQGRGGAVSALAAGVVTALAAGMAVIGQSLSTQQYSC
jgi:hypothetical protein